MACTDQQRSSTRVKTEFVKVGRQVVHLELHTLETDAVIPNSSQTWPKPSDIKEISTLLQTVIEERLSSSTNRWRSHDTAHKRVATKPCVISGEHLRLAYSFKNRAVHQNCLLPARGGQYNGFTIFREKVVVYACPLHQQKKQQIGSSPAPEMSLPSSSSYFTTKTDPCKTPAPEAALRKIIKKSGPKLSKVKCKKDVSKTLSAEEQSSHQHAKNGISLDQLISGRDTSKDQEAASEPEENDNMAQIPMEVTVAMPAFIEEEANKNCSQTKDQSHKLQEGVKEWRPKLEHSQNLGETQSGSDGELEIVDSTKASSVSELGHKPKGLSDTSVYKSKHVALKTSINDSGKLDVIQENVMENSITIRKNDTGENSTDTIERSSQGSHGQEQTMGKVRKWTFKLKHDSKRIINTSKITSNSSSEPGKTNGVNASGSAFVSASEIDKVKCSSPKSILNHCDEGISDSVNLVGTLMEPCQSQQVQGEDALRNEDALGEEWGEDLSGLTFEHIDEIFKNALEAGQLEQEKGSKKQENCKLGDVNSNPAQALSLVLNEAAEVNIQVLDNGNPIRGTNHTSEDKSCISGLRNQNVMEPNITSEAMDEEVSVSLPQSHVTPKRTRKKKSVTSQRHQQRMRWKQRAKRLELLTQNLDSDDEPNHANTEKKVVKASTSSVKTTFQHESVTRRPSQTSDLPSASFVTTARRAYDSGSEMDILQQAVTASGHVRLKESGSDNSQGPGSPMDNSNLSPTKDLPGTPIDCSPDKEYPHSSQISVKRPSVELYKAEPSRKRPRIKGRWKTLMKFLDSDSDAESSSRPCTAMNRESQQVSDSQAGTASSQGTSKSPKKHLSANKSLFKSRDHSHENRSIEDHPKEEKQKKLVNAFTLMSGPKKRNTKKTGGIGSQLKHVALMAQNTLGQDGLEEEVKRLRDVDQLNEIHLAYIVTRTEAYLRDIFTGKRFCQRHQEYKQGGKARSDLRFQIPMKCFEDDQRDIIMDHLLAIFCIKHNKYLDYVMKVMLPECLMKIYMVVHDVDRDVAETALCPPPPHITIPGRFSQSENTVTNTS